jgi:hypothetical protein
LNLIFDIKIEIEFVNLFKIDKMETKAIRKKLISDFGKIIQDDSKILVLEGVFDAITNESSESVVPEAHYLIVEEARQEYLKDKSSAISWDDFEKQLVKKYDL